VFQTRSPTPGARSGSLRSSRSAAAPVVPSGDKVSASAGAYGGLIDLAGPAGRYAGSSVTLEASTGAGGTSGIIKVGEVRIDAYSGRILLEVGASGLTDLAGPTYMNSPVQIDVAHGPHSKCAMGFWAPTAPLTVHCVNGSF
jgi:hypothetical protein